MFGGCEWEWERGEERRGVEEIVIVRGCCDVGEEGDEGEEEEEETCKKSRS